MNIRQTRKQELGALRLDLKCPGYPSWSSWLFRLSRIIEQHQEFEVPMTRTGHDRPDFLGKRLGNALIRDIGLLGTVEQLGLSKGSAAQERKQ